VRLFRWLSATDIPPACDLRRRGWYLVAVPADAGDCIALADRATIDAALWKNFLKVHGSAARRRILLLGVTNCSERARLLHMGFGEVLGDAPGLSEVEARALRLYGKAETLPRYRDIGPLRLDLLVRDGYANGRPLRLHPREFGLIWRLADTPGRAVSKSTLLKDVWRLEHVPDTNSLAVHVFRLRDKLALAGLDSIVQTAVADGYLLTPLSSEPRPAIPLITDPSWLESQ
jgi:two-component system, OmpR family, response regulator